MNKNVIGMIIIVIVICVVGCFFLFNHPSSKDENKNTKQQDSEHIKDNNSGLIGNENKILVVYFSATNNTKNVAEKIAKDLNAALFKIEPQEEYTSGDLDYSDSNSRVSKEHDDETLRNVKLKKTSVDDWDRYDTIIIGYPIWWGIAAWPMEAFVKANDFNEKTVIPFCTSASSGLGESGKLLESVSNGGKWLEGYRFSSNASDSQIKAFMDKIK